MTFLSGSVHLFVFWGTQLIGYFTDYSNVCQHDLYTISKVSIFHYFFGARRGPGIKCIAPDVRWKIWYSEQLIFNAEYRSISAGLKVCAQSYIGSMSHGESICAWENGSIFDWHSILMKISSVCCLRFGYFSVAKIRKENWWAYLKFYTQNYEYSNKMKW